MTRLDTNLRKSGRALTDMAQILDLIARVDTIHLGISDAPFPYVVPVSFGYEYADGDLSFFFHGARQGKKLELLKKNPHVCVEGDLCHRFLDTGFSVTCLFESFIAFGDAEILTGQKAVHALAKLLEHCGFPGHPFSEKALGMTTAYRVRVDTVSGKRRTETN